jgi:dipeptidyl aminopeptidase/acylaminoacyl peptidase
MNSRWWVAAGVAMALTGVVGCKRNQSADEGSGYWAELPSRKVELPELGGGRVIKPGVRFWEATLRPAGGLPMRVWYYRPESAKGKLPLVLVPPAGSTLVAGMGLGDGDRAEHYPYVDAGFAVASFEIDGEVPNVERASDAAIFKGAREFRDARAGLVNVKLALDFLLAQAKDVDANRVYIAGHSSAATLALLAAEYDPRIKACAAYAPATDVMARLSGGIGVLEENLPGYREFLRFSSPNTHPEKLTCPVFLFHARDDENVPVSQTEKFAEQVRRTNPNVTLVVVRSGGHYESMVNEGVPKGIAWFKGLKE